MSAHPPEPSGSESPQGRETSSLQPAAPTPDQPEVAAPRLVGAFDLEADVERLHRPIYREVSDPREGREPAPWWVWCAAVAAIFWGGWYLGRHGGAFGTVTHAAFAEQEKGAAQGTGAQEARAAEPLLDAGRRIYLQHCRSCHQENGQGLPGVFPPLVGSEWVTAAPESIIRILLNGLAGPVEVGGDTFNGAMPAWRDVLGDGEIAAVATYVRQWKPNDAPAVSQTVVSQLRTSTQARSQPWTAAELRATERGRAHDDGE